MRHTALLSLAAAFAVSGLASGTTLAAPIASLSTIEAGKIFETVAARKQTHHAPRQLTNTRSPITNFSSSSRLHVGLIHKSGK